MHLGKMVNVKDMVGLVKDLLAKGLETEVVFHDLMIWKTFWQRLCR